MLASKHFNIHENHCHPLLQALYSAHAASETCHEALQQKALVLCKLEEIVFLLERKNDGR
jgi:hypothetical protein